MFSKGNKPHGPAANPPEPLRGSEVVKNSPVPSIISNDLKITGNLSSSGDIQIDGFVEGDVASRTLTIGEDARVDGSIVAESVRICGMICGEVKATSVVLAKTARVEGDIAHQSLAIEAGAFIQGNIRRLEPESMAGGESKIEVISGSKPPPATKIEAPPIEKQPAANG